MGLIDLSFEDYLSHPAISNTDIGELLRSPQHFLHRRKAPRKVTPALEQGTAIHAAILEPDKFYESYVRIPDDVEAKRGKNNSQTKEYKTAFEDFCNANAGRTPLKGELFDRLDNIIHAVYSHDTASQLLQGGRVEQSIFWLDEETGILCKGRCDYLRSDGVNVDIKSTDDASFRAFQGSIQKYSYHRQGAFYLDGLKCVFGKAQVGHTLIAVEKEPPHSVAVYVIEDESIAEGRSAYREGLRVYSECLLTKTWPGYPDKVQGIGLRYL